MSSNQKTLPTPEEVEKALIQRELESQQKPDDNPLNAHAQLFYLYNPRFQGQLNFMSSKQLVKLAIDLAGSEYNKQEDVDYIATLTQDMNKKGLLRVIMGVVEHPLNDVQVKLMNKKEQKLFHLFDDLLVNKYMTCIQKGMEKMTEDNNAVKQVEDVIIHLVDTTSNEFQKRERVEKDAFATGNKLLASKFLMMLVTFLEKAKEIENIDKEKNNE